MNNIIISPVISEKSIAEGKLGKFSFRVVKTANKNAIRKAIEDRFSVNVTGISTNIVKGKTQRVGARRSEAGISDYKKAIVMLKKGQKINVFEEA